MEWEKMLGLPAATLAGNRRIPKTQLVAQGRYTKREEKLLAAAESLTHVATFQKSNTPCCPSWMRSTTWRPSCTCAAS